MVPKIQKQCGDHEQVHNLIVINIHYGCGTNSLL